MSEDSPSYRAGQDNPFEEYAAKPCDCGQTPCAYPYTTPAGEMSHRFVPDQPFGIPTHAKYEFFGPVRVVSFAEQTMRSIRHPLRLLFFPRYTRDDIIALGLTIMPEELN